MPISSNASYIPTANEFLAHWAQVNDSLTPLPNLLVLAGGITIDAMEDLRDDLIDKQQAVQSTLNGRQIAKNTITFIRGVLMEGLSKLNGVLDTYYADTIYGTTRPKMPGAAVPHQEFADPMMDAKDMWARVEEAPVPAGAVLPLVLPVNTPPLMGQPAATGMDLAQFSLVLNMLQDAYAALRRADKDLELARKERNEVQSRIYEALKNYRTAVPARLATGHVLLETLPKLSPDGTRTPDGVNASAVFVPPDKAKVVFEASTDPDLAGYELHAVAGDEWSAEDAEVVATLPAGADPREFLTTFSLNQPGAAASFSVYVVLNTGNSKGSAPMTIQRPLV